MPSAQPQPDEPIVLFDGVCGLCNATVSFVLKHERSAVLRFAPLQSDVGRELLRTHGRDPDVCDTIVLIEQGAALDRSDAACRIASYLKRPWCWARVLSVLPRWVREPLYRVIARHRYRFFGRLDACRVPDGPSAARFIDT